MTKEFVFFTLIILQVGNDTNNAEGDVYPTKGKITFLPGQSTVVYNIYILDDQVSSKVIVLHL